MVLSSSKLMDAVITTSSSLLYNNFINSIKSEATKIQYVCSLKKYMKYHSFNDIEQLLGEPKLIEANIIQYIMWLRQDQKLSAGTIQFYLAAIMHFYAMNNDIGVTLNRKKITMYLGEYVKKKKDRAYTTDEIHKLLEFCDERSNALVLLLCSTRMRIGAVVDICQRHLKKIDQYGLYHLIVYEGTKGEHYTFTTPEAAAAIDNYLDYRKRHGEKLIPDSPLFREQFDVKDPFEARYPKKMNVRALCKLLDDKLHKSGLVPLIKETEDMQRGRRRNDVSRAHGFRKFVTTNMIRAKLNAECREMLLGHKIGLTNAYYKPGEEEVLEEYLKAVDFLTINAENRLKREVETLKIERSKIEELQSDLANLKSFLATSNDTFAQCLNGAK